MAWWNQPEGSVTPTVTLRRLAAWLAVRGHRHDLDLSEGVVHFSVAGFDYVLMVVDRRILAVRAHHRLAAALPEAPRPARAADEPTGVAGAAEVAGGESTQGSVQTPVAATQGMAADTAAGMADATVEMAAVVDGPVPGVPGDAQGGTGAETTDTPKPLLVS